MSVDIVVTVPDDEADMVERLILSMFALNGIPARVRCLVESSAELESYSTNETPVPERG